eukprot:1225660-Amphidinium_carterae.1
MATVSNGTLNLTRLLSLAGGRTSRGRVFGSFFPMKDLQVALLNLEPTIRDGVGKMHHLPRMNARKHLPIEVKDDAGSLSGVE